MDAKEARKQSQREVLIDAAEHAIAAEGLPGLKARSLANQMGIALGAIYNLVADLDELYLRVASRTLARLDAALASAASDTSVSDSDARTEACARLTAIALAYRRFASENLLVWRSLFEHRMAPGKPVPEWAMADQMKLFRHILQPLEALIPQDDLDNRMRLAQTLFSAVHGIVMLGLEEKFIGVAPDLLDRQIEILINALTRGLTP